MKIKVYHGDNYGLETINGNYKRIADPSGNMALGLGIYFTEDIKLARRYGNKIVSTIIDKNKLLPALSMANDVMDRDNVIELLKYYNKESEDFWYYYSDFGINVSEPEDLEDYHAEILVDYIIDNEVRNFMIELWQRVGDTKIFVDGWLKNIDYYGVYDDKDGVLIVALLYNDDILKKVEGFKEFKMFSQWKKDYLKEFLTDN
jgi:hypothetical protein